MLTGQGGPDGGTSLGLKVMIFITSFLSVPFFAVPAAMITWGFELCWRRGPHAAPPPSVPSLLRCPNLRPVARHRRQGLQAGIAARSYTWAGGSNIGFEGEAARLASKEGRRRRRKEIYESGQVAEGFSSTDSDSDMEDYIQDIGARPGGDLDPCRRRAARGRARARPARPPPASPRMRAASSDATLTARAASDRPC